MRSPLFSDQSAIAQILIPFTQIRVISQVISHPTTLVSAFFVPFLPTLESGKGVQLLVLLLA